MRKITWLQRLRDRPDMTSCLIHLTRRSTEHSALTNLYSILLSKTIKASNARGTIAGTTKCVCFQETPVVFLSNALLAESKVDDSVTRYEGYGIRVDKDVIFQSDGRQVIYDTENASYFTEPQNRWRFSNIIQRTENYYIDWSHEREWRVPHDFSFEYSNIDIIVSTIKDRQTLIEVCAKEDKLNILTEVRSIIVLEQLFN